MSLFSSGFLTRLTARSRLKCQDDEEQAGGSEEGAKQGEEDSAAGDQEGGPGNPDDQPGDPPGADQGPQGDPPEPPPNGPEEEDKAEVMTVRPGSEENDEGYASAQAPGPPSGMGPLMPEKDTEFVLLAAELARRLEPILPMAVKGEFVKFMKDVLHVDDDS